MRMFGWQEAVGYFKTTNSPGGLINYQYQSWAWKEALKLQSKLRQMKQHCRGSQHSFFQMLPKFSSQETISIFQYVKPNQQSVAVFCILNPIQDIISSTVMIKEDGLDGQREDPLPKQQSDKQCLRAGPESGLGKHLRHFPSF